MLKFASDENFNNDILRGLLRHNPELDIERIQDNDLIGAPDPEILEWTASEDRILLTEDISTLPVFMKQRLEKGHQTPGIIIVPPSLSVGQVIDELYLIAEAGTKEDFVNRIIYLDLV